MYHCNLSNNGSITYFLCSKFYLLLLLFIKSKFVALNLNDYGSDYSSVIHSYDIASTYHHAASIEQFKSMLSAEFNPEMNNILGITSSDHKYAIAFTHEIFILNHYNRSSYDIELHLKLSSAINGNLIEFKFINSDWILYCDVSSCRSCSLKFTDVCVSYHLVQDASNPRNLEYVTATVDSMNRMILRYVASSLQNAAILKFNLNIKNSDETVKPIQWVNDISLIDGHHLATAFNRNGYTFFVGSARRPYEPYINARKAGDLLATSLRITRICDSDETENLESRIDMALTCTNIKYSTDVQSLAGDYLKTTDQLTVALQTTANNANYACNFNMNLVNDAFDQIWNICQDKTNNTSSKECWKVRDVASLPPHCFIFTRMAEGEAMRTCSRFGGNALHNSLDNCNLHEYSSFAYRYGWLEQFKPFEGDVYTVLPEDVVALKMVGSDNTLFIISSNGVLNRVASNSMETQKLWSYDLTQIRIKEHSSNYQYLFTVDSETNQFYFVTGNEVKYGKISCESFYTTCDSLEATHWSDPLRCVWCAMNNGSGFAISANDFTRCNYQIIQDICPPFIEHVVEQKSLNTAEYEVLGGRLNRLRNAVAKLCNHNCMIKMHTENKIICVINLLNTEIRNCDFYLEGNLLSSGRLNISYIMPKNTYFTDSITKVTKADSFHLSRQEKALIAVLAILILSALIVLIPLFIWRYWKRQRVKLDCSDERRASPTLFKRNYNPNETINNEYPMNVYNRRYESLLTNIDPKLKIPLQNITFGVQVGRGNFGVVYKAVYRDKNGRKTSVACKTIESKSDGVLTGVREFLREGLIMANFDHPNVVKLIGLSLTKDRFPIIITDYLSNGDLQRYIKNSKNRLTLGDLLRFGIQIAGGMLYLHEKKFIHRDLAARNCMLDSDLVVKISDFGLSRDVSRCGLYEAVNKDRGIPIRWMPLESLDNNQYTFKADVWAYGVVLWELATRGLLPYGDLEFVEIYRLLRNGHRLSKPNGCPDNLYKGVMLKCWIEEPSRRPSFYELEELMRDIVEQIRNGICDGTLLDSHYERASTLSPATSVTNNSNLNAEHNANNPDTFITGV